ncbi:LacI family transcriptional regulator [Ancylomarina euxinus]|uniref:LacI family transcriptional regulator n=1 Tax=Ancylomarina euxinus TaxID=2283627 RepID=A0A425XXM5_9BACT|nr:LacI family DNA-binding transcriptional regulator [Ancylomarina euxinus]MCZ4694725.1 LacI family DNA-binding transcriptional regulator [Ancylomarina euxinus]MUP16389.1 LacI family DNA-binding transcriptional regulator [Ancylomarina euxinus]RRG19420.1 LacI family transcriptional regulator [Ancylomarina euxinus]
MKKKSIKDIAQDLGLSKTTVSFVLNNKGDEKNISSKTQKRVLDYIREVNYQPNQIAKSLKKGNTNTIGYLVPDISNPFFAKIGRLLEDHFWEKGYHLLIGSTDENKDKEEQVLNMFVNRQVDALIVASCFIQGDSIKSLLAANFPLVFFDREDPDVEANYILVENKISMKNAVEKSIQNGARKLGLISLTPDVYSLKNRIEGYKMALINKDIGFDQDLIRIVDNNDLKQGTERELRKLIELGVDTIVFTNNQIAVIAIWLMNTFYKDKVNSIKFVSFDNVDQFDYSLPKVISVAQPIDKIAKYSTEIIEDILNSKKSENKRIELTPKLIERK